MVMPDDVPKSSDKFLLLPPRKAMSHSSGLNSQCDVQVIVTDAGETDVDKLEYQKSAYVAVALILAITAVSVLFPIIVTSRLFSLNVSIFYTPPPPPCNDSCRFVLVESIPENLTFIPGSPSHPSIFGAWMDLIHSANQSINIASFYWSMRGRDLEVEDPSDWQGEAVYKALLEAGTQKSLEINIVQSQPQTGSVQDTLDLEKAGAATVRTLNMTRLMGGGVLHTKFWIVDNKHVYVGSANQDWRSLTQVKELGAVVYNCSCLARDLSKIFAVYWDLALHNSSIPAKWPASYETYYNKDSPLDIKLNGTRAKVYISSSPPPFSPRGRTDDLGAILDIITKAKKYVHIAVMDYVPLTLYTKDTQFWPLIDDALRKAAIERGVEVKVLASYWNHTGPDMLRCLASLNDIDGVHRANVQVKLFHVPTYTPAQARIPFARVNHNKYMVTDQVAYIGTSNWSGDYFINTAGVGLVVNQSLPSDPTKTKVYTVQKHLQNVFNRDWTSEFAKALPTLSLEDFL